MRDTQAAAGRPDHIKLVGSTPRASPDATAAARSCLPCAAWHGFCENQIGERVHVVRERVDLCGDRLASVGRCRRETDRTVWIPGWPRR